jgi:hypothetical protein
MAKLPAEDSDGAATAEVFSGQKYWGLKNGLWGVQTGAMALKALSASSEIVAAGMYAATTLSTVDSDLISSNIKSGVTIFGVSGDSNVVDTSSGDAKQYQLNFNKKAWVGGVLIIGDGSCF